MPLSARCGLVRVRGIWGVRLGPCSQPSLNINMSLLMKLSMALPFKAVATGSGITATVRQ
jgi:hypothetical protein